MPDLLLCHGIQTILTFLKFKDDVIIPSAKHLHKSYFSNDLSIFFVFVNTFYHTFMHVFPIHVQVRQLQLPLLTRVHNYLVAERKYMVNK